MGKHEECDTTLIMSTYSSYWETHLFEWENVDHNW
jgi:hypothetical protein